MNISSTDANTGHSGIYYRTIGNEIVVFEHCHTNHLPLLLKGPTGSGKSRFVEHMAERLELPLYTVSCHEETSAVDLIGRFVIRGNETVWQDGPVTRAVREGALLYIDEVAEARPDTIVSLHSLTDHRRSLFIERTGEQLHAPATFMLIAAYNPGYQGIARELKSSTKQRFVSMSFDYPEQSIETEIVARESRLAEKQAAQLVKLARKIRNLNEPGLAETVSTRLLVNAAKLIHQGLPPRSACRCAIVEPLSDDDEIKTALLDIVTLSF
ncbi:MAG: CbbQ/NirQ/NorQ/GpvN family protein [Verrucomicrobiales bacterium]|nr:CbbQ/NirQ/NorQ/GpvN family protein [Verrucomicrobiales bacterium]